MPELHPFVHSPSCMAVERDQAVDTAAASGLEKVYREQAPRLWRALLAYSGDQEVAADALAEAFAQAVARGAALRTPKRWVWTVAFRLAAGELKERRRRAPAPSESAPTHPMP
jgi:DNA-directed RNA polymerase specialized sigma24 family protein